MGGVEAGAGGGGGLRTYAGGPVSAYGAVSKVADGPNAGELYLCAAGGGGSAGTDGDFRRESGCGCARRGFAVNPGQTPYPTLSLEPSVQPSAHHDYLHKQLT